LIPIYKGLSLIEVGRWGTDGLEDEELSTTSRCCQQTEVVLEQQKPTFPWRPLWDPQLSFVVGYKCVQHCDAVAVAPQYVVPLFSMIVHCYFTAVCSFCCDWVLLFSLEGVDLN
jgi:hypothetical protein